jgi:hypothetical protein
MIGRVLPFHVAKIVAGTERTRDFLIASPEMCGSASAALDIQV